MADTSGIDREILVGIVFNPTLPTFERVCKQAELYGQPCRQKVSPQQVRLVLDAIAHIARHESGVLPSQRSVQ